jgi:hypothetical protein
MLIKVILEAAIMRIPFFFLLLAAPLFSTTLIGFPRFSLTATYDGHSESVGIRQDYQLLVISDRSGPGSFSIYDNAFVDIESNAAQAGVQFGRAFISNNDFGSLTANFSDSFTFNVPRPITLDLLARADKPGFANARFFGISVNNAAGFDDPTAIAILLQPAPEPNYAIVWMCCLPALILLKKRVLA